MSDVQKTERGPKTALGAYFIIPIMACGLTVYYLVSTIDLVWEAKATGFFLGGILLVLCTVQFVRLGLRVFQGAGSLGFGDLAENTLFNRQRLALLILIAAFIVTLQWVGTTLGLFLVLVACMWVMGVRSLGMLVGVALTTALVVHLLLIQFVGSQLPQGIFKDLFSFSAGGA